MNNKMYTVKEIAEIIGVSKQAIHKKIKQEPLSTGLQSLMTTTDNTIYISIHGLILIRSAFDKNDPSTVDDKTDNHVDNMATKLIDSLQVQIDFLKEQITLKDTRINELTNEIIELTDKLAALFENSQQLQQNQQLLQVRSDSNPTDEGLTVKKTPFLLRIFGKK